MSDYVIRSPQQRDIVLSLVGKLDLKYEWDVTVKRHVKRRSMNQNALLHKWLTIIANEIGDDMESVKRDLKHMFAPVDEHTSKITGETEVRPMATSKMSVGELSEFMEKIQAWAWSFAAIGLPSPEDRHDRQ